MDPMSGAMDPVSGAVDPSSGAVDPASGAEQWWRRVDGLDGPMDGLGELVHGFVFTFVFPDSFSQVSIVSACENIDFRKWALRLPL